MYLTFATHYIQVAVSIVPHYSMSTLSRNHLHLDTTGNRWYDLLSPKRDDCAQSEGFLTLFFLQANENRSFLRDYTTRWVLMRKQIMFLNLSASLK